MSEIKRLGHLTKELSEKQKFEDLLTTIGDALSLPILQGESDVMSRLRSSIRNDLQISAEMFLNHKSVDPQLILKILEKCEALETMHGRMK